MGCLDVIIDFVPKFHVIGLVGGSFLGWLKILVFGDCFLRCASGAGCSRFGAVICSFQYQLQKLAITTTSYASRNHGKVSNR